MKLNKKRLATAILTVFTGFGAMAQMPAEPAMPAPADYFLFPIKPGERNYLSGTMGEIRSNHFHGGLDIKTDQRVGLNVHAAADGYISRVKQSSYGYGNIIYVTHPNGLVTTYAHLLEYYKPLADYMLQKQYEKQVFDLELFPEPGQFPVKRGDVIGLSGNTGGSGGPHLHFEIRDKEDRLYNPLRYTFKEVLDTTPPDIYSIGISPLNIHARVGNAFERAELRTKQVGTNYSLADTVFAHGLVGLELQTIDRLDGATNKNGTQEVTLFVNGEQLYTHYIDRVPFELSRQVSQHINYDQYKRRGRTFQKAFVDHGNDLPLYKANGYDGRLKVQPDSVYQVKLVARDSYNNTSTLSFTVKGQKPSFTQTKSASVKKPDIAYEVIGNVLKISATDTSSTPQNIELFKGGKTMMLVPSYINNSVSVSLYDLRAGIPDSMRFCGLNTSIGLEQMVPPAQDFQFRNDYLKVSFDKQSLYDTLYLHTNLDKGVYTIGDYFTPLHKAVKVTIKADTTGIDKRKAAVYFLGTGRGRGFTGGKWEGNTITFYTKNMGKFKVLEDTKEPYIRLISKSRNGISFKISDDLSGLNSFNAWVDGKWILMKYEHKNATIWSEKLDKSIPLSGEVVLKVKDNAGNEATYTTRI
ncbi:M23 family metallopeptidase [Pontibacter anaerobius]|uniref:M23 family metallopeptidase n=1 Tax=Pontibacter anaerobius TaxID=2993940 RepID=A0ABT3REK1_9BACT|nr:M23 family metallopeptidase [Pontibacter anaerobius]MCX2739854.1 M23 family metallopeptidase [Pontibacter anaerobius]